MSSRSWVLRLLLVVILGAGLSAMHVLSGAVGQQHDRAHQSAAAVGPATATMATGHGQMLTGDTLVFTAQTSHHDHHAMADCVLFLSTGIAVLVVLLTWAAARALRPSCWLTEPWLGKVVATTPWRGPPPWHWPRISLCVIRV